MDAIRLALRELGPMKKGKVLSKTAFAFSCIKIISKNQSKLILGSWILFFTG